MKQLHYFQLFPHQLISNFVSDFFYCNNSSFAKFTLTAHYCTLHSLMISHHHFILSCCQEIASGQRQSRFVLVFFLLFIHFLSLKNKMATFPVCFQLKFRWSYLHVYHIQTRSYSVMQIKTQHKIFSFVLNVVCHHRSTF